MVVVLPASIWAIIPILRSLARFIMGGDSPRYWLDEIKICGVSKN